MSSEVTMIQNCNDRRAHKDWAHLLTYLKKKMPSTDELGNCPEKEIEFSDIRVYFEVVSRASAKRLDQGPTTIR